MAKSEKNEKNVNASLLNVITPMGLEFSRNGLIIGEQAKPQSFMARSNPPPRQT
ncbi:hypothetical protein FHR92_004950 [Fontibacillus solani]|uniref:Uncharacterized protein n=1 Tax=Fontibacillus solani TaxID=1572857 RepID=A0A7W3SY90_9BACL|nr:hypothetical protein [Fontibacillus solani]MBA9088451.1 hypothetical protein [Fontibacillus solani]